MALDIVSNGLNCILNAHKAKKSSLVFPTNRLLTTIVSIMVKKKYLESYSSVGIKDKKDKKNKLKVSLRYSNDGDRIITSIKRFSKSSRRMYSKSNSIPRLKNGFATLIISTPKGVMTGKEAREQNVGGEIICSIF